MERHKEDAVRKLAEMIQGMNIAMLTTVEPDGGLRSRPMAQQQEEFDGVLWFFTWDDTPKVQEVEKDHNVNLSYSDERRNRYVSVSGRARKIRDPELAKKFWSPALKAWFPQGLEDPRLSLLRVEVDHAEYWDSGSGKMLQIIGFLKAIATGKPLNPKETGDHDKINLAG